MKSGSVSIILEKKKAGLKSLKDVTFQGVQSTAGSENSTSKGAILDTVLLSLMENILMKTGFVNSTSRMRKAALKLLRRSAPPIRSYVNG